MGKKEIQEKRKRGYFIEAAKKIIREEGTQNLTVKKVADLAGFAPGTLYNYFSNLNALYAYCVEEFWNECKIQVERSVKNIEDPKEKIIVSSNAYANYFIDNQNVFKLIFLEDLKNVPEDIKEKVYNPEVVKLLGEYLKQLTEGKKEIEKLGNIVANYIHGILLFFIMDRADETREEINNLLKNNINYILESSQ